MKPSNQRLVIRRRLSGAPLTASRFHVKVYIIPLTILVLERKRGENKYFQPPSSIENEELIEPESSFCNY
jgi:hypothetical protein